jgi:hypothetical protein
MPAQYVSICGRLGGSFVFGAGTEGFGRHRSEQNCRPLANLDRLGLVDSSLIAVHMTQLTDAEIDRCGAAKVNVVHCPSSNLKLASGMCPIAKLAEAGATVCIGTDSSASNNTLGMGCGHRFFVFVFVFVFVYFVLFCRGLHQVISFVGLFLECICQTCGVKCALLHCWRKAWRTMPL